MTIRYLEIDAIYHLEFRWKQASAWIIAGILFENTHYYFGRNNSQCKLTMFNGFNGIFYAQEKKAFNWPMIIITSLMIIGLLMYALFSRERLNRLKNERSQNARYTIGITIAKYKNIRLPNPSVEFCYYVNFVKYVKTQSYPYEKDIVSKGGRYYVEFSRNDPSNAKLLIDKEAPELSEAPPADGWSKLPN